MAIGYIVGKLKCEAASPASPRRVWRSTGTPYFNFDAYWHPVTGIGTSDLGIGGFAQAPYDALWIFDTDVPVPTFFSTLWFPDSFNTYLPLPPPLATTSYAPTFPKTHAEYAVDSSTFQADIKNLMEQMGFVNVYVDDLELSWDAFVGADNLGANWQQGVGLGYGVPSIGLNFTFQVVYP